MQAVFITGTDRGIGLEFVKQYAEAGWRVLATYLGPKTPEALRQLSQSHNNVILHRLDVTDFKRVQELAKELEHEQIDLLINNAGIFSPIPFGSLDPQTLENVYRTNAIAPLMICEAFQVHLKSKKGAIVSISSKTGSIGADSSEDMIGYRMSKAALNMAMREVARKLAPHNIQVLLLAPGYVKSQMSPQASLEPVESVQLMRQVISKRSELESGGFYDRFGKPIPW